MHMTVWEGSNIGPVPCDVQAMLICDLILIYTVSSSFFFVISKILLYSITKMKIFKIKIQQAFEQKSRAQTHQTFLTCEPYQLQLGSGILITLHHSGIDPRVCTMAGHYFKRRNRDGDMCLLILVFMYVLVFIISKCNTALWL